MSVHLLLLHEHHLLHLLLLHRQHLLLLRRHLHTTHQQALKPRRLCQCTQLKGYGAHLALALLRVELLKPLLPALVRMLLAAPTLSTASAVSESHDKNGSGCGERTPAPVGAESCHNEAGNRERRNQTRLQ